MKTRLTKLEDFTWHIKEAQISRAYLFVEHATERLLKPAEKDKDGKEVAPAKEVTGKTSTVIISAKAEQVERDSMTQKPVPGAPVLSKQFIFLLTLQTGIIENDAESKAYSGKVKAQYDKIIEELQKQYPSCMLFEGSVE